MTAGLTAAVVAGGVVVAVAAGAAFAAPAPAASFTVSPSEGAVGTVFSASGAGCVGAEGGPAPVVWLEVRLHDVPGASGREGFVVEAVPVPVTDGRWVEPLDSGTWPHWVAGSDPIVYEGVGANPGVYGVSAVCGLADPAGGPVTEPLFAYDDQFLTVTAPPATSVPAPTTITSAPAAPTAVAPSLTG